jgi:hypothetical protein
VVVTTRVSAARNSLIQPSDSGAQRAPRRYRNPPLIDRGMVARGPGYRWRGNRDRPEL